MSSADRLATLTERIEALNRRMENHMHDMCLDPDTLARMAHLHAQWRSLLAANMAAMERLSTLLPDWRELVAENIAQMEQMTAVLRRAERRGLDTPDDAGHPSSDHKPPA